jgi:hemolysin activation/secretion protein
MAHTRVLFLYHTRLDFPTRIKVAELFYIPQIKTFVTGLFAIAIIFVIHVSPLFAEAVTAEVEQHPVDAEQGEIEQEDNKPEIRFDIWEYQVAGNSLLERTTLERALSPYLGPGKSSSVINDAADALEALYKDNGYPTVFVDIPEQNVVAGVVRLQVNQGVVSRLRVTGADYFTLSSLKEKVPSLQTGQTLHMPSVQAEIQKLHSYSPDLQAVPILKAGRDPGTMEIELRVKDKLPLHGSLELNNHYSANTTKSRLEGSISYDNLWQKFHSIKLLGQVSPEDTSEVRVLVANYIMPVNDDANRLAFYAVNSDSNVSIVGGLAVIGKGNIYGTRYVIPLKNQSRFIHSTTLGFDYKDVEDLVNLEGGTSITTPIQYVVAIGNYSATVLAEGATTRYLAGLHFGVLGPNSRAEFENKRYKANPDFLYFRGSINRSDYLPLDVNIESVFKLQLSDSPLISNEQFTAGGYLSVRGYYQSQALGDDGVNAGLELYSPKLFYNEGSSLQSRVLAFAEGAYVEILEPLPGQIRQQELYSAGIGLRVTNSKQLVVKLDWAYPLREAGDAGSGTLVSKGDSRLVFSLAYSF